MEERSNELLAAQEAVEVSREAYDVLARFRLLALLYLPSDIRAGDPQEDTMSIYVEKEDAHSACEAAYDAKLEEVESLRRDLLQVQGERDALIEQVQELQTRLMHLSED